MNNHFLSNEQETMILKSILGTDSNKDIEEIKIVLIHVLKHLNYLDSQIKDLKGEIK